MDLMDIRRGLLSMITHTSGGDPIPAGCEIGVFSPTEDELTHTVSHNLGVVPKFAAVFAVPNGSYSDFTEDVTSGSAIIAEWLGSNPSTGDYDPTYATKYRPTNIYSYNGSDASFYSSNPYTTYPESMTNQSVTFVTGRYYGGKFLAGKTYLYVMTK